MVKNRIKGAWSTIVVVWEIIWLFPRRTSPLPFVWSLPRPTASGAQLCSWRSAWPENGAYAPGNWMRVFSSQRAALAFWIPEKCSFILPAYNVSFPEVSEHINSHQKAGGNHSHSSLEDEMCSTSSLHWIAPYTIAMIWPAVSAGGIYKNRCNLGKLNGRSEILSLECISKLQVFSFFLSDSYNHSH